MCSIELKHDVRLVVYGTDHQRRRYQFFFDFPYDVHRLGRFRGEDGGYDMARIQNYVTNCRREFERDVCSHLYDQRGTVFDMDYGTRHIRIGDRDFENVGIRLISLLFPNDPPSDWIEEADDYGQLSDVCSDEPGVENSIRPAVPEVPPDGLATPERFDPRS